MSQVKDIIDGIKHRIKNRDNVYSDLNRAVRMVSKRLFYHNASMVRGSLSVTIAEDASSGSLPSDFWGLVGQPYISGKTSFLKPVPDQRYKLLYTTVSIPLYYEVVGTTLNLIPGSSSEITIVGDYWTRPAKLTKPTDTMPFNELFDEVIQEAIVNMGDPNGYAIMNEVIRTGVDEIVPYIDKAAPVQVNDDMNLDSYTNEWGN